VIVSQARGFESNRWIELRFNSSWFVFCESAWHWAVAQTVTTAGTFGFDNFVHVVDVLHFRMHRALGTGLAAEAAGDAETLFDSNLHFSKARATWIRPRHGSAAEPRVLRENQKLLR
jgi:hypothetical protein